MTFSEAQLKGAGFSGREVENLKRRQRGGTSGESGYHYQRRYAVLRTCELATIDPDAEFRMECLCPVDDVVVRRAVSDEYAQCKISPNETWTRNEKKLTKEFRRQRDLLNRIGVTNYLLKLIVANPAQRDKLAKNLPYGLASSTRVECVEVAVPEHQPWRTQRFADALNALLPPALRNGLSQLEELFKSIDAAADRPWQVRSARDILERAVKDDLPLVLPQPRAWTVSPEQWDAALALLGRVPGLVIDVTGGICCYTAPNESGFIARCDSRRFEKFVKAVIATPPQSMQDFFEARP